MPREALRREQMSAAQREFVEWHPRSRAFPGAAPDEIWVYQHGLGTIERFIVLRDGRVADQQEFESSDGDDEAIREAEEADEGLAALRALWAQESHDGPSEGRPAA
jgi:hypothetical protein